MSSSSRAPAPRRSPCACRGACRSGRGREAGSAAALVQRLKGMCGLSAEVEIAAPGGVERSLGKARRVIDKRPKD